MHGTIKRLVSDKKFGFILGEDKKEYFFHATALKNARFDDVAEGAVVEFEDSVGDKGLRAEDIYVDQ
jgi:cold shock protein